jgi:hypothetical protein
MAAPIVKITMATAATIPPIAPAGRVDECATADATALLVCVSGVAVGLIADEEAVLAGVATKLVKTGRLELVVIVEALVVALDDVVEGLFCCAGARSSVSIISFELRYNKRTRHIESWSIALSASIRRDIIRLSSCNNIKEIGIILGGRGR